MLSGPLVGQVITGGTPALIGDRVEAVEPKGKHLLIRFGSGRVLHVHRRMTGYWRLYPTGTRVQGPARVVLQTEKAVAACFNAPTVELLAARSDTVHPWLTGLGPDILATPLDVAEVIRRAEVRADAEVADLLLDQQVVSGVGNIWRSETLFVARVHPRTPTGAVDLQAVIETAARLMHAGHTARWVYRRARRPCRRCGTPIVGEPVGVHSRTAYWCPRCQDGALSAR